MNSTRFYSKIVKTRLRKLILLKSAIKQLTFDMADISNYEINPTNNPRFSFHNKLIKNLKQNCLEEFKSHDFNIFVR